MDMGRVHELRMRHAFHDRPTGDGVCRHVLEGESGTGTSMPWASAAEAISPGEE